MTDNHSIEHDLLIKVELILTQDCHPLTFANRDLPFVRFGIASQNFKKCGFSGTIGTDKTVAVTGGELDVDVFKNCPFAISQTDI